MLCYNLIMSDKDIIDLIDVPPEDQMGEAMLALEHRQRLFVCALGVFGGDQQKAYAYAGYKTTNERSTQAASSRLVNSEKIVQAIREETIRRLGSAQLMAISTIAELASPMNNPDKKLRFAAAQDILNRVGLGAQTLHTVVVRDERTTNNILEALRELGAKMPVPVDFIDNTPKLPDLRPVNKVIDAEFDDVPDELKDLF